jgi:hypothetical protein
LLKDKIGIRLIDAQILKMPTPFEAGEASVEILEKPQIPPHKDTPSIDITSEAADIDFGLEKGAA